MNIASAALYWTIIPILVLDGAPLRAQDTPASGTMVVHVAKGGNDTQEGTAHSPFATFAKAFELVTGHAGPSEIVFHKGEYRGGITVGERDEGAEQSPLLIRAAKKVDGTFEEVTFFGEATVVNARPLENNSGVFRTKGNLHQLRTPSMWEEDTRTRYELVADLTAVKRFKGTFCFEGEDVYFHTSDDADNATHRTCMSDLYYGFSVEQSDVTIRGLRFRGFLAWKYSAGVRMNGHRNTVDSCSTWNAANGFTAGSSSKDCRVVRCLANDVTGGVYSSGEKLLVENSRLFKIKDTFEVKSLDGQDDSGIQYYSPSQGGVIRGNLIRGFAKGLFIKNGLNGSFLIEHNTCVDNVQGGLGPNGWGKWKAENMIMRNNIVSGSMYPLVSDLSLKPHNIVENNCFWHPYKLETLKKNMSPGLRQKGNRIAAPRFLSPATGDYRLLPDGPCIAMGTKDKPVGAFGVAQGTFEDRQPPSLTVSAEAPAQKQPAQYGLFRYVITDTPRLGSGNRVLSESEFDTVQNLWFTPAQELTLNLKAHDLAGMVTHMQTRLGDGAWSAPLPFAKQTKVPISPVDGNTLVQVRVKDQTGNWSDPQSLLVHHGTRGPAILEGPDIRTNENGILVTFETDIPCRAKVRFGRESQALTSRIAQSRMGHRTVISGSVHPSALASARTLHTLIHARADMETGHYFAQVELSDAAGNKSVTPEICFEVGSGTHRYHVSTRGEDQAARGTAEAPWKSLQYALDRALPGDEVILEPGLYPGTTELNHGGLPGAPITIRARERGTAILDGRKDVRTCLSLSSASHVVIDGLEIRWYKGNGVRAHFGKELTIRNCRIWNDVLSGWVRGVGLYMYEMPGSKAHGNVVFRNNAGIYLYKSPGSRITHNTVTFCMQRAIDLNHSIKDTEVTYNCLVCGGSRLMVLTSENPGDYRTFTSNHNNLGTHFTDLREWLKSNPQYGTIREGRKNLHPDFRLFAGASKHLVMMDGKWIHGIEEWREVSGQDEASIFADPKYANPRAHDFRPLPGSPNLRGESQGATIGALSPAPEQQKGD